MNGPTRQDEYNRIHDFYKNKLAQTAIRNFQKYAARHSIFLPEDLRGQFDTIRNLLWSASVGKTLGRQVDDWKMQRESWEKLEGQAEPLFQEIRNAIQVRIAKQMELNLDGLNMVKIE
jgi:hypothetical protein